MKRSEDAGRAELEATTTRIVIIGSNRLDRDCAVAALSRVNDVDARAYDESFDYGSTPPDVVVLQDFHSLSSPHWLSTQLASIEMRWRDTSIVVLGDEPPEALELCLYARVRVHLPADSTPDQVVSAIRLAQCGLIIYPIKVLDRVAPHYRGLHSSAGRIASHDHSDAFAQLTARQLDVLRLIAIGTPNKEIARALSISDSTVKVHVRAIMKKMGVANRSQVVARLAAGHPISPVDGRSS